LRHNTEYFDMPVNTYSAGMRARLAFGTCLAIDFDVYLIDEVTETGDERFRRKCATAFRERLRRSDIILATHNSQTIRQYCDRGAKTEPRNNNDVYQYLRSPCRRHHQFGVNAGVNERGLPSRYCGAWPCPSRTQRADRLANRPPLG